MTNESENENLLKLNINKEYSVISNIEDILSENTSQINDNIEKSIIKKFLLDKNSKNLTKKEKCLRILEILSKFKIFINYNCATETFYKYISHFLINDSDCHLVAIFKENMLNDYVDEFLRRAYNPKESKERLPKFSKYYKNYLQFFCKPTFRSFQINKILNKNGEKKAEIYYKNNYQGGKSQEDDENIGFAKSSSFEEDINKKKNKKNKENIENINNLAQLFDETLKEKIENVTIMTTINASLNNTLNLKLDNEKIEIFSENKCDKSNDTTLHDIMKIIKIKKDKNSNLSLLKKELMHPSKEKNEKENKIINNNSYKNIKIKGEKDTNNIPKNQNPLKNNNFFKLSEKIIMNGLNKETKDKIKKIIQHQNNNKKNKDKETKKQLKINASPSSILNNQNYLNNDSDIITSKKNAVSNNNKNKSNIKRSRNNNIGFLYKQTYTNYNNINQNNNIIFKTNKFNSTTLHKANKNINFNNNIFSSINNNNNFPLKLNNKINNNVMIKNSINNNNSKYYVTNSSLDNKATSMKILEGYTTFINKNEIKNKNKIYQDNLIYKLKKQNHNNFVNNNYNIIQENNNISLKKYQHQHYNSLSKKLKSKPSLSYKRPQKSMDPTHAIGTILFDGNSSTTNKTFNKNANNLANNMKNINYTKIINNNILHLNNNTLKELKKYTNNNSNNNYNININNQIIINANLNNYSYNTNLKELMNNNFTKPDYGIFNLYKNKNILNKDQKHTVEDNIIGINNNNIKKNKTRNINTGLKKYYSNPFDENEISPKNGIVNINNKIMKSYNNKKAYNISNLLNDNKKMLFLKKRSKNKSNKI